jgi:hypothetical protein
MPVSTYITNIFRLVFGKPVVTTEVKADDIQKPEVEDFKALTHHKIKEDAYVAYKKALEAGESFLFEAWCVDVPRVRGVRPINKQELEAFFSKKDGLENDFENLKRQLR